MRSVGLSSGSRRITHKQYRLRDDLIQWCFNNNEEWTLTGNAQCGLSSGSRRITHKQQRLSAD